MMIALDDSLIRVSQVSIKFLRPQNLNGFEEL